MVSRKVGKIHSHALPAEKDIDPYDVYRCECGKEFFVGLTDQTKEKTNWLPLGSSPHYVEYGEAELDSPLIGRYDSGYSGVPRPSAQEAPEEAPSE